jgi:uncharacterized delta-60 repeat protein
MVTQLRAVERTQKTWRKNMNTVVTKFARNFLSTRLSWVVVCAALVSASTLTLAQAGHLDKSFASAGIFSFQLTTDNGSNSVANAVALQSDGKIVAAGQLGNRSGLIRLNSNGRLDPTFGNGGVVVVNKFGGDIDQVIVGMAIQPDGKIVAAATGVPSGGQVARFNPDGTLDTTFGTNGIASVPLNAALLAFQPDGKVIVTGGRLGTASMARLNSNGQPDTTFGTGGVAPLVSFGSSAIALESDGKIVIGSGAAFFGPAGALARYNKDGSVDKSFGISGQAASVAAPSAITVQSDGKILAVGADTSKVSATGNSTGFGLVCFNPDGSIDTTFGTRGGAITGFPKTTVTSAFAAALQPNGDIVAAGEAGNNNTRLTESFALARYVSEGKLDSTFGTGGRVTTSFGSGTVAFITSIVLQSDGKIVVAGTNGGTSLEVARYLGQ